MKRLVLGLCVLSVAMFFFSYALVPLYNVLCSTLGLNGKPQMLASGKSEQIDKNRIVRVQFVATNNAALPWEFYPKTRQIDIHPGENAKLAFYAKNNSNHIMTIQAVPSITPGLAAAHLKKTECFCFTQQTLKPKQFMDMPLIFHLDNTLPKNINELTLSYTIFEAKKSAINRKTPGRLAP